jgi:ribonuclease VapC
MVLDTSALICILADESEASAMAHAIEADPIRLISAATLVEAGIVTMVNWGSDGPAYLDRLLEEMGVEVVEVTHSHARLAREAYATFGKGRHRARLNFGDCFSYALARASGEPLLAKGSDFGATDLVLVPLEQS